MIVVIKERFFNDYKLNIAMDVTVISFVVKNL